MGVCLGDVEGSIRYTSENQIVRVGAAEAVER